MTLDKKVAGMQDPHRWLKDKDYADIAQGKSAQYNKGLEDGRNGSKPTSGSSVPSLGKAAADIVYVSTLGFVNLTPGREETEARYDLGYLEGKAKREGR